MTALQQLHQVFSEKRAPRKLLNYSQKTRKLMVSRVPATRWEDSKSP